MRRIARTLKSLAGLAGLFVAASSGEAQACEARSTFISDAHYADPSNAYGHGAVKDGEWAHLTFTRQETRDGQVRRTRITLAPPEGSVFEGPAPIGGCGDPLYAVESSQTLGARAVQFGVDGNLVAAGDWIGTRHRWISLVSGICPEGGPGGCRFGGLLAIDRPHLKGDLQLLTPDRDGHLRSQVIYQGVTNHRLGSAALVGGRRLCGGSNSFVFATMDWSAVVRLEIEMAQNNGAANVRETARFSGTSGDVFARAMACD